MFGYSSLEELPDLPRYRVDENKQIVIDDLIEENKNQEDMEQQEEKEVPVPQENSTLNDGDNVE